MAAHNPRYSLHLPPSTSNDLRLPSLKDLNFPYRPPHNYADGPSVVNSTSQLEHLSEPSSRHSATSWPRTSTASMQQHHPQLSNAYDQTSKSLEYSSKHDGVSYLTSGAPLSAPSAPVPGALNYGASPRLEDSHKRTCMGHSMPLAREMRPPPVHYPSLPSHYTYQSPPPAGPYPLPQGPSHEPVHHPVPGPSTHTGYGRYVHQQYMPSRGPGVPHLHPHPQHPPHSQHPPHGSVYPHPPPPPHRTAWTINNTSTIRPLQHPPPPPPPHHPPSQASFQRTSGFVGPNVDSRLPSTSFASSNAEKNPDRDSALDEIMRLCSHLYHFANHYAQAQPSLCQPAAEELTDMARRATEVVRRIEDYQRLYVSESERKSDNVAAMEDHHLPKRPWEDLSQDTRDGSDVPSSAPEAPDKPQSTAEQDMEIIRIKRATTAAGISTSAGQPKGKYRKRSVSRACCVKADPVLSCIWSKQQATPPGKCHSCNIRETPEWRRGPDGARTLCNACGLHYAKLQRKRQAGISEPRKTDSFENINPQHYVQEVIM